MLPPTFQAKPTPPLRRALRMPSIDPTEVPLFSSSVCIFVVQAHLLLPPPLSRCRSPSPLSLLAGCEDWPVHHVPKDCLPPDVNIMRDRVYPAFLEHVFCGRVDPHLVWSSPGLMFLSHPVCTKYSRPWHTIVCHDRPEGLPPKIVVQSQLP